MWLRRAHVEAGVAGLRDHRVFHRPDSSNTYEWDVDDDVLRLRFVKSTLPGYRGIPDEVFQRALYMTSAFTRQR